MGLKYKLMFGDCLERMKEIPDGTVDLVVTSPPYDNLRSYGGGMIWNLEKFKLIAEQLFRVISDGGVVVWVVNDEVKNGSESGTSFRQALFFKKLGFNLHDTMIWKKQTFTDTGSLRVRYGGVFEYMFVFSRCRVKTFNPIKDRPNKSAGKKRYGTIRQTDGTLVPLSLLGKKLGAIGQRFNVWEINTEVSNSKRCHPAQFPEPLAADHIVSWSNPGDTILDPFLGSGTTGLVSLGLGRNFIGIECVSEYFKIAKVRIKDAFNEA